MEKGRNHTIIWSGEPLLHQLSEADALFGLCIDKTEFWNAIWRQAMMPVISEGALAARAPIAGTSGRPQEYVEYCNVKAIKDDAIIPIITHSRCGFWRDAPVQMIMDHGHDVASALNDNRRLSFAAHLELRDQDEETKVLIPHIHDPLGLGRIHPIASTIISSIRNMEGMTCRLSQLEKLRGLRLVIVEDGIFGAPPEEMILALIPDFAGQLFRSLDITHELNGRRKVPYECASQLICW